MSHFKHFSDAYTALETQLADSQAATVAAKEAATLAWQQADHYYTLNNQTKAELEAETNELTSVTNEKEDLGRKLSQAQSKRNNAEDGLRARVTRLEKEVRAAEAAVEKCEGERKAALVRVADVEAEMKEVSELAELGRKIRQLTAA